MNSRRHRSHRSPVQLVLAALVVAFVGQLMPFMAQPARAAGLILDVDTTIDDPALTACTAAPGDCSLRGATIASNDTPSVVDTIVIPAGTYEVTATGPEDEGGSFSIMYSANVAGAGSGLTILDGQGLDRVMDIARSAGAAEEREVTMSGLTLRNGNVCSSPNGTFGGGLLVFGVVTLDDLVIEDNVACENGGGIELMAGTLLLRDSVVRGNRSVAGGGIHTRSAGLLTVERTTISGNFAQREGGGVGLNGSATIAESTISGNSGTPGGGIFASDGPVVRLTNSTVSENVAHVGRDSWPGQGGGIALSSADLIATHATIVDNEVAYGLAAGEGAGIWTAYTVHATFINSVMARNVNRECSIDAAALTIVGSTICPDDPSGIGVAALADNGGSTLTNALEAGSPLIDAGDQASCLETDQRGIDRPQGVGCDQGAFELAVQPPDPINHAPVATGDTATVPMDAGPVTIDVLANDTDPDGDPISLTNVTFAGHGSIVLDGDGLGLTYQPAPGYHGPDGFDYTISDGRGAESSASVAIDVEGADPPDPPSNSAPVLDPSRDLRMTDLQPLFLEGDTIAAILGSDGASPITDPDPGALEGIAITSADGANGSWQFSLDDGSTWTDLGTVSELQARLLPADAGARIRFTPTTGFAGTVDPALTFRAWDRTSGSGTADVGTPGGTSAYSAATDSVRVKVQTPTEALAQLASDGGSASDALALMVNGYGLSPDQAAALLRLAGYEAEEVMRAAADRFGLDADRAIRLLYDAGFLLDHVIDAAKTVFAAPDDFIINVLSAMKVGVHDFVVHFVNHIGLTPEHFADLCRQAGYTADEVWTGFLGRFGATPEEMMAILRTARFTAKEAMLAMKNVVKQPAIAVLLAAKNVGYKAWEVVVGLRDIWGKNAAQAADLLQKVRYNGQDAARAIAEGYAKAKDAVIKALFDGGYSVIECANALKLYYLQADLAAAITLKAVGFNASQIAAGLRDAYSRTPGQIVVILKDALFKFEDIARALKVELAQTELQIIGLLRQIQATQTDIGFAFKLGLGLDATATAGFMRTAGYTAVDIGNVLKTSFGKTWSQALAIMKGMAYSAVDCAWALASAFGRAADQVAKALWDVGFSVPAIISAIVAVFNMSVTAVLAMLAKLHIV